MKLPFTAEDMRKLPDKQVQEALSKLTKKQLEELQYTWEFWARDKQLEPDGDWYIWYISADPIVTGKQFSYFIFR